MIDDPILQERKGTNRFDSLISCIFSRKACTNLLRVIFLTMEARHQLRVNPKGKKAVAMSISSI